MPLTVADLREFLDGCHPDDVVVVQATLGDGSALGVRELTVGTGQGGEDGNGFEVVIDWEPGDETTVARDHMTTSAVRLTMAEALVIFDWLHNLEDAGEPPPGDAAEQVALHNLSCLLEALLVEPFQLDYGVRVDQARRELVGE